MVMSASGGGGGGRSYNPLQDIIGRGSFSGGSSYPAALSGLGGGGSTIGSSPTGSISRVASSSAPLTSLFYPGRNAANGPYAPGRPGGSVYTSQVPSAARGITTPASPKRPSSVDGGEPPSIADIMGGMPQWDGGGVQSFAEYLAQANKIYDPQMDYLAGLESQSKKNAATSGTALDDMYAELARSIGAQSGEIKQNYNTALADTGAADKQAMDSIKESFDNSRNGTADTLRQLGIEEAGTNTVGQNTEMQQMMQGILSANSQATKNELVEGRQGTLDYNTANQTGAKLAGGEARAGLAKQLQGFLNELGLKKADVQTQIQNWAMEAQSGAQKSAYEQYRDQVKDWQWGQGFTADQAAKAQGFAQDELDRISREQIAAANNAAKSSSSSAAKLKDMDPIGALNTIALDSYGGNEQAAGNAVRAITDAARYMGSETDSATNMGPGGAENVEQFMAYVEERAREANNGQIPGDIGNLRRLAQQYWERIHGK